MNERSIGRMMNRRHRILFVSALCLAAGLANRPALAQARVGEAVIIQNQVVRVSGSASTQINVGDGLLRDEVVHTGLDSAARLVMADSTNLSLGPNATIRLDRTVFNDQHTYREISIRLATGAFRFVTGNSAKAAYKLTNALGAIGVRGTILDILSERGKLTVVLQDGRSRVCAVTGLCVELLQPGDTAIITSSGGKVTIQKFNTPPWSFAANCAAAAGLCTVTRYADAAPAAPYADGSGMLCGR